MITATFFVLKLGEITGFEISGHSELEERGKDIVCAAISSAAYMAANTITEILKIPSEININEKTGFMQVHLEKKYIKSCREILLGFKLHLTMLEEIYPKNLIVNYMEVQ